MIPSHSATARAVRAALLCLALLPAGSACPAQNAPATPSAVTTTAPTSYDQDFAAVCKTVEDHFYDPGFNSLDWPRVRAEYAGRVKSVTSDAQFLALVNDLLGRLHASHTRLYGPDDFEFYLLPQILYGHIGLPPATPTRPGTTQDAPRQVSVTANPGANFYQIGCLMAPEDPARVAAVLDGSPAAGVGLRAGDVLVSVDGQPYHGLTQFDKAPTRIVYRRQGAESTVTVTPVARTPLGLMLDATEKSARVLTLPDGRRVGYVRLWCMGDGRFQRTLEGLVLGRLHDTDGLVLDLRQGYGGSPDGFADPFFRPDIQVSERNHQHPQWTQRHEGYTKPLVVLVDHGTRSAKEWLAWTLQESRRATLVGQRTAGAELALGIFPIGGRFLLELAVQDLALNGVHLEGRGVQPNVALAGAPSDGAYLQKALQVFAQEHPRS